MLYFPLFFKELNVLECYKMLMIYLIFKIFKGENKGGNKMSVFRINKNDNYTVMSNYHLKDKNLTYKAMLNIS